MPRHQATSIRRGPGCLWAKAGCRLGTLLVESRPGGCLWAKAGCRLKTFRRSNQISAGVSAIDKQNELMGFKIQRVESKRVDEFANMSDEELRQYVYGNRE